MKYEMIETFLSLVQTQSLSLSARELNLAQSTISLRLSQLEGQLGCVLFERRRGQKKALLSSKGRAFIPFAEAWRNLYRSSERFNDPAASQPLSIGAIETLNSYLFDQLYQELFDLQKPRLSLQIRTRPATELYHLLHSGQIDIGLTVHSVFFAGTIMQPLLSERYVLLAPPNLGDSCLEPRSHCLRCERLCKSIDSHLLRIEDAVYMPWTREFLDWHTASVAPVEHCALSCDLMPLALRFMEDPKAWMFAPISVAKRVAPLLQKHCYELENPPPERICYKITRKVPLMDRIASLQIFEERLRTYIDKTRDFTLLS